MSGIDYKQAVLGLGLSVVLSAAAAITPRFSWATGWHTEPVSLSQENFVHAATVAIDSQGDMYIAENDPTRIVRVKAGGDTEVFLDEHRVREMRDRWREQLDKTELSGSITDMTWHQGKLYVVHGSRFSVYDPQQQVFMTLVDDLPRAQQSHPSVVQFDRSEVPYIIIPTRSGEQPRIYKIIRASTPHSPHPSPTPPASSSSALHVSPSPQPSPTPQVTPSPSPHPTHSPSPTGWVSRDEFEDRMNRLQERMREMRERVSARFAHTASQLQSQRQEGGGTQEQEQAHDVIMEFNYGD